MEMLEMKTMLNEANRVLAGSADTFTETLFI